MKKYEIAMEIEAPLAMCKTKYIAHAKEILSAEKEFDIHPLEDHLRKVAKKAQDFAQEFGAGDWAYPAGLWHDLGKYRAAFQAYIQRGTGINPDAHMRERQRPENQPCVFRCYLCT